MLNRKNTCNNKRNLHSMAKEITYETNYWFVINKLISEKYLGAALTDWNSIFSDYLENKNRRKMNLEKFKDNKREKEEINMMV